MGILKKIRTVGGIIESVCSEVAGRTVFPNSLKNEREYVRKHEAGHGFIY